MSVPDVVQFPFVFGPYVLAFGRLRVSRSPFSSYACHAIIFSEYSGGYPVSNMIRPVTRRRGLIVVLRAYLNKMVWFTICHCSLWHRVIDGYIRLSGRAQRRIFEILLHCITLALCISERFVMNNQ